MTLPEYRDSLAIVIDHGYGLKLATLYRRHMLWVVYSVSNQDAVSRLWEAIKPLETGSMSVTIGTERSTVPDDRGQFDNILDSVIEHFPGLARILVVGGRSEDWDHFDASMMEYGYVFAASVAEEREYVKTRAEGK